MRKTAVFLLLAMLVSLPAFADCTQVGSISSSSVQIIPKTTISGGRKYVAVQNVGSVTLGCAINSGNTATVANTLQIGPGVLYEYPAQASGFPPQGDVSCYAVTGTGTATACEY